MTNATLRGKPDAGNPHVRFDEGEVASGKSRHGSLLYKALLVVVAIAAAIVSSAGDYTFTGGAGTGDLSNKDNWGGTLPGSDDSATIDGSTAGRNSFTRSGTFGVGAFSLLSWTNAMLLDLNAGSASASTFTVGGTGPVVVSNGTLSVSGKVTVNAASVLTVAKDATIELPDSVTKGNELAVGNGGKLVIDGGTYQVPCTSASSYGTGNTFGSWDYAGNLEIKNGGSFVAPSTGRAQVTAYKSHITVTGNSTFDISKNSNYTYPFTTGRGSSVYAVTNSTFKWFKWCVGGNGQMGIGSTNARFTFHNSTVASSQPLSDTYNWGIEFYNASGNQWLLDGADGKSAFSVKFSGTGNSIVIKDGEHAGQVRLEAGSGNSFTLDGATYTNGCSLTFGGSENVFSVKKGSTVGKTLYPAVIAGVSNRLEIAGSTVGARNQTLNYAIDCMAFQYKLTDHAKGHIGQWGNNPAMTFGSAATNTLVSVDDSTLVTEGYVDLSGTLPPGIVFEFKGAAPSWTPLYWQGCRRNLVTLGAANAAEKETAPRFRFVLPETPYAAAPVSIPSGNIGWFGVVLNPTAKLAFDFSQMGTAPKKRLYPLITGASASADGTKAYQLTQAQVDQIAANSNLPEGCSLVLSGWTVSLKVKGTDGMVLIFR